MFLPISLEAVIITHHVRVRSAHVRASHYGIGTFDLLTLHTIPDFLALKLAQLEPKVHILSRLAFG